MTYAPPPHVRPNPTGPVLHPWSEEAIGIALRGCAQEANTAGTAWPAANAAILVPFGIRVPITVQAVFWHVGTTGAGNVDIGVYDLSGTLLTSLGSTARGSNAVINQASLGAAYTLAPGDYYMAMASDTSTGHIQCAAPAAGLAAAMGVCQATSAFALPSSLTPAVTTYAVVPLFGLHTGTWSL